MINGQAFRQRRFDSQNNHVAPRRNWHRSCSSNIVTTELEAIMDWDDLLTLLTLGAVAPYLTIAATDWVKRSDRHPPGADAPG